MGYNLGLKTKTFGGDISILDSAHARYIRGAVTVDKSKVSDGCIETINSLDRKILRAGTFLAKLSTGGKVAPAKATALSDDAADSVTVLKVMSAKYFQPGDVITVDGVEKTIAAAGVDYENNEITITAALGTAKTTGAAVVAVDGGTAFCVTVEDVDVTDGDQVTTAVDHARLISARLPVAPSQPVVDALKGITFV